MRRVICGVMAGLLLLGGSVGSASAWWGAKKPLVTINGVEYSSEEYQAWWRNWRDEGQPLPETPDVFIDWQLMAQEGETMQLEREPSYRQKVETFLKVRSLMLLKMEEVDSKVSVKDEAIWNRYVQDENPRWRINILLFADEALAGEKAKALRDGSLTMAALAEAVGKEGGPQYHQEKVVRAPKIHELWRKALSAAQPGTVTEPFAMNQSFVVLQLVEVLPPDLDDLKEVRAGVLETLTKEQSGDLTGALVEKLKRKYAVQVDEALLATLGPEPPSVEAAAKFVITTNRESITAADFWAQMEKERAFRAQFRFPEREIEELRKWVLGNMISQTLISWEALERHYEEREPLKPLYDFYRRHRLAKEFERRFVADKAALGEDEAKKYYEENRAKFQSPEMIHYAMIEGEKDFVTKVWDRLAKGHDFFAVAKELVPTGAPLQQVPVSHVGKELLTVIDGLKKGEMSRPFAYNDGMAVVKLVDRKAPSPIAYDEVAHHLRQQLGQEKYQRLKKELLETLRTRSEIRVDEAEWEKIRRQLEESEQGKKNS